ncbi:MAG TPA: DUF4157 domain-containing protein [Pyrinomonadaceae bacterium]
MTQSQGHVHAAKPEVQAATSSTLFLQRKCACGGSAGLSADCAECEKEKMPQIFRRASGPQINEIPPAVHNVLRQPGRPLDSTTRSLMEPGFGHNFSDVRVHSDAAAAQSARMINALAYTVGRNVVFGEYQYSPSTTAGKRLLAHELAHVVQQERAGAGGSPAFAGSRWEREADAAADAVLSGRNASVVARTDRPLLSMSPDTKEMKEPSGAIVHVERSIKPGKCSLIPQTRKSSAATATGDQAFLELDYCSGTRGAHARGEINYGDALRQARIAAAQLVQNLQSQQPQQALQTFQNALAQIAPNAKVDLSLQGKDVRIGTVATGDVSKAGGASGSLETTAAVDLGPFTVRVQYTVEGGTSKPTSHEVVVTVGSKDTSKTDRNCFICRCTKPIPSYLCRREEPPGNKQPPAPPAAPVIVALFFKFEKTDPREDWIVQYQYELIRAAQLIKQGYTITNIEGNTSPEGPERPKKKGGFNNTDLAQDRADKANKDLRQAISAARSGSMGLSMRDPKSVAEAKRESQSLNDALAASYPVKGLGELFGKADGTEIPDRDLATELKKQLITPEGKLDTEKLEKEHITGAGLSKETGTEVEERFREFEKTAGEKKKPNLESIYRPMRRALIFLKPPPPPKVDLQLKPEQEESLFGKYFPCTKEHEQLFDAPSESEMLEGECNKPDEETIDLGPAKP